MTKLKSNLMFKIFLGCVLASLLLYPRIGKGLDMHEKIKNEVDVQIENITKKLQMFSGNSFDPYNFSGGYVIAKDGKIIYKKGFGYINSSSCEKWEDALMDTQVIIGSNTKQFTATVIMELSLQGKLDINDPISKHLSWYTPKVNDDTSCLVSAPNSIMNTGQITIQQLLEMSSGLPQAYLPGSDRIFNVKNYIDNYCSSSTLCFKPGTKGDDNNCNYYILGAIIAEILSKDLKFKMEFKIDTNANDWMLKCFGMALEKFVFKKHRMNNSGYYEAPTNLSCGYLGPISSCCPSSNNESSKISKIPEKSGTTEKNETTNENTECPQLTRIIQAAKNAFAVGGVYSTLEDLLTWGHYLNTVITSKNNPMKDLVGPIVKSRMLSSGAYATYWDPCYFGYGVFSRYYDETTDYCVQSYQDDAVFIVEQAGYLVSYITMLAIIPTKGYTIVVTNNTNNWVLNNSLSNIIAESIINILLNDKHK